MNNWQGIGNIGADLELRHTENGKAVCSFNIAVKEYNKTIWVTVVAWNKTAEAICQYCEKGSKIGVSGRLDVREWTDKEGQKRRSTEVVANSVDFLGGKKERNNASGDDCAPGDSDFAELDGDDGFLPF